MERNSEQPKCETCGGSGKVFYKDALTEIYDNMCFDCKGTGISPDCEQPKASDKFTKDVREIYEEERNKKQPFIAIEIVLEACDKLDSLQAELAEKDKRIEGLERYAQHSADCQRDAPARLGICTCGLEQALKAEKGE